VQLVAGGKNHKLKTVLSLVLITPLTVFIGFKKFSAGGYQVQPPAENSFPDLEL
jgi:hypothetical protein